MANAPRKKYAMQDPAVMAYQAALQGDTAARYGGQAGLEAKTNDTNAGLVREQQEQQQMQQPRGFASPQIDHSGNSSASKDELRRLRWAAESAVENAPRKKYAMQHPAVMAYQAALQGDTAARYGGQAGLEAKTNDTNAGLVREQMQQQGANQRDAGRLYLDQQRVGMEATTKGFDVRQAQRRESAQKAWQKATPDQRSQLQKMYPDLFGENSENLRNNFMAVGGGQEWDTTANVMRTVPQRLIDLRTMQEVGGGGVPRGLPQVGAVQDGYRFKGGNPSDRAKGEQ